MAPPSWATEKQLVFLTGYVPLYETYQQSRRYQPFWDLINAAFLKEWPILPPGPNPDALSTKDESKAYSKALTKLYKVRL